MRFYAVLLALTIWSLPLAVSPVSAQTRLDESEPDKPTILHHPKNMSREAYFNLYLKEFPPFRKRRMRQVIIPPKIESADRENYLLELRVGKLMVVQPCGSHRIGSEFIRRTATPIRRQFVNTRLGYLMSSFGDIHKSVLFCSTEPDVRFVEGVGARFPIRQDLPIVVYIPKDSKLTYRFWKAPEELLSAQPYSERYFLNRPKDAKN